MQNWVEEKPGFEHPQDVPIMPTDGWLYQRLKNGFEGRNDTVRKNVFVRKIELHHPVTQLLELLHCRVLLVEDGGLGNGEITFVSLQLAQYGLMKLFLT